MKTKKIVNENFLKECGRWKFDGSVAEKFDAMLHNSIPSYNELSYLLYAIGNHFIDKGKVIDLGCGTGTTIERLTKSKSDFYLFDNSVAMLEKCRERFSDMPNVHIKNHDIRDGIPTLDNVSLIVSCLTLQFVPIEYRQMLLSQIYDILNPGGAFILVEKVICNSWQIDSIITEEYYNLKREFYSEEQIQRKRLSLEGSLVPVTMDINAQMLKSSGFSKIDVFWRSLNFCGFLAIK